MKKNPLFIGCLFLCLASLYVQADEIETLPLTQEEEFTIQPFDPLIEDIEEQAADEIQTLDEPVEEETPVIFDFHDDIKSGIIGALSAWKIQDFLTLTDFIFDNEYFGNLGFKEREATVSRYFTFASAAAVLIDNSVDVYQDPVLDLKHQLEEKYSIDLDSVSALRTENEQRVDVAYSLFLTNLLAVVPPEVFYSTYKTPLSMMGFDTSHDQRAIKSSFEFVSFIAIKSTLKLVQDDQEKLNQLEELSRALDASETTIMNVADKVNEMFM